MEAAIFGLGAAIGILSGFAGIGGGTVLVPLLVLLGLDIKEAIGISVVQMVFSSIYGSVLNHRRGLLDLRDGLYLGLGGFLGALGSGTVIQALPSIALEVGFVGVVALSILRFVRAAPRAADEEGRDLSWAVLLSVGAVIGLLSISMGIGGSILLTPILAGVLGYPLKKAVSSGLFFVAFSSVSGLLSLSAAGGINYVDGALVGIGSLAGVWAGIRLAGQTGKGQHKKLLVGLYSVILVLMLGKMFGG